MIRRINLNRFLGEKDYIVTTKRSNILRLICYVLFFVVLILPFNTNANYTKKNYTTYVAYTGDSINFKWSPNPEPDIDYYEIIVYNLEKDYFPINIKNSIKVKHPSTNYIFHPPFSGHFIIYIRAVDLAGNHSQYTKSTDATSYNPNGFWIYSYIKPVSELEVL